MKHLKKTVVLMLVVSILVSMLTGFASTSNKTGKIPDAASTALTDESSKEENTKDEDELEKENKGEKEDKEGKKNSSEDSSNDRTMEKKEELSNEASTKLENTSNSGKKDDENEIKIEKEDKRDEDDDLTGQDKIEKTDQKVKEAGQEKEQEKVEEANANQDKEDIESEKKKEREEDRDNNKEDIESEKKEKREEDRDNNKEINDSANQDKEESSGTGTTLEEAQETQKDVNKHSEKKEEYDKENTPIIDSEKEKEQETFTSELDETEEIISSGTGKTEDAATLSTIDIIANSDLETVTEDPLGTMLPIEEEKVYLLLPSDVDRENIPLEMILNNLMYEDGSKVEISSSSKAIWAYVRDSQGNIIHDEYHEIKKGTDIDLSSISPSDKTFTFELIVGKGLQLDYNAKRYIVRVFIGADLTDYRGYSLWKEKDGVRSKVTPKDFSESTIDTFGKPQEMISFILSEIDEDANYYVGLKSIVDENPVFNLNICSLSDFGEIDENEAIQFIWSDPMSVRIRGAVNADMSTLGKGLPVSKGQNSYITFYTIYLNGDNGRTEVFYPYDIGSLHINLVEDEQSFSDNVLSSSNDQIIDVKYSSHPTTLVDEIDLKQNTLSFNDYVNVIVNQIHLKKGFSADDEYYYSLDAHSLVWKDANEHVSGAYSGWYHTIQEAVNSGKQDIKNELIPKDEDRTGLYGYKANYALNKDGDGGGQIFTVFFDDNTVYHFGVLFYDFDPEMDYYMKDYDTAPIVGSKDPWFRITGLMLDGKKLDTYIVENGKSINMDTYYGYGYQAIMVNQVLSEEETARLIPIFEVGDEERVTIRLPGSEKALVSGQDEVDFSGKDSSSKDDDVANFVALIDGYSKNYQVRVASKNSGPKLYVYDDYTNEEGLRFREVLLNDYFEEKHDILIANLGDEPLTGLRVTLDLDENANHVKLDDYWNIGGEGNDTLEPFTTTQDLSTYGMIPNVAKIRLIPDGKGDIEGKLIISANEQDDVVIYLSNHARQPVIINDELRKAVKWVPYSYIIATNNMYDWNTQTFSISSGELPPGMTIDENSGEIYGAPDAAGDYTFTVKATYSREDYFAPSEKEFTIKVLDNEDETVYKTSDESYEIINEGGETGYIGKKVSDYRFEIESFDEDEVYISNGEYSQFVKLWLNGEVLDESAYNANEGSTRIVINKEVLERKSRKNEERNTISAEFNINDERGENLKRTSQNYYVIKPKSQEDKKDPVDDKPENTGPSKPESSRPESSKPEPLKPEPSKPEPSKPEPSKPDLSELDAGNEEDINTPVNVSKDDGKRDSLNTDKDNKKQPSTTNNNNTDRDTNSNSSGTVTINAKLIDSSGTPLQGFMMEMHSTVKKNRTNSSGIATFSGTEIGNHVVYILNSSGNSTANFRFSLKKGEKFSRKGNVFTVVPGQTINLTITLNGSTAVISDVSVIGGDVRSADTGDKTIPSKWVFSLLISIFGVMIVTHLKRKYK